MEPKQCRTQAEGRIDRAMTMKGWIAQSGIDHPLEAKDRIVAIAMIAGVVEEVAPININKRKSTMMRTTSGTLTKGLTMSKMKLLKERNLLKNPKEGDMETAKKMVTENKEEDMKNAREVVIEGVIEVVIELVIEVDEEATKITREVARKEMTRETKIASPTSIPRTR